MSNEVRTTDVLKSRNVVIAIAVAVVIILIWLLAFFFPQGSKLSKLNAQVSSLQNEVTQGNAKVAALKKEALNTPALEAISAQLKTYVPATPDIYNYITLLSSTAQTAGVSLTTLTPSQPATSTTGSPFSTIQVTVSVSGTYDNTITFVKDVYGLSRLTSIGSLTITGGGSGSNRGTTLASTMTFTVYTSAKPALSNQ